MKKLIVLMMSAGLLLATQVTFNVDLSLSPDVSDVNTIALQIDAYGWWPGVVMDDGDGDMVYSVTIDLDPGNYEYKFAGYEWSTSEFPDWSMTEAEAGPCMIVDNCTGDNGECQFINRFVNVDEDDLMLDDVCWSSCDACPEPVGGELANGGFESDIDGWGGDHNGNYYVDGTGAAIYNSDDIFEAYEGTYGLKIWGRFDGTPNNEFSQEFIVSEGNQLTFSGYVFSHPDDLIGPDNQAYLSINWSNDAREDLGSDVSDIYDATWPSDVWTLLNVTGTAPATATRAEVAINYIQNNNGDGSVYWDAMDLTASEPLDVAGCTDDTALNYNPYATVDDGSCLYEDDIVNVTFNLDMACEGENPDPYLAGGETFGNPGDNPLTDPDGDNIWTITVQLPPNSGTDYTFTNGACGDWSCKEDIVGQDCATEPWSDRHLDVGTEDIEINTCFSQCVDGSCGDCGDPNAPVECAEDEVAVTFYVDLSEVPDVEAANEIALMGTFNGWWPGDIMDDFGGSVYGTTVCLQPETYYEYKFAGYQWTVSEFPDGDYEVDNPPCPGTTLTVECQYGTCTNRFFTTGTEDMVMDAVYWAGCDTYPFVPTPNVTFQVDLSQNPDIAAGNTIVLQGDFAGWWPGIPMEDPDGDLLYTVTVPLEPGYYEYKFAGYEWSTTEFPDWSFTEANAPDCVVVDNCTGDNGECQFINRFIDVTEDVNLDPVFWGTCDIVPSVPQVTFQVDLSENLDLVNSGTQIALQADFAGWWPGIPMEDPDGDLVYTVTVDLDPGYYEYKFAGYEWAATEFPDWSFTEANAPECLILDNCTGDNGECQFSNRFVTVEGDMVLDEVCWASCEDCVNLEPTYVDVTFQVDMSYENADDGVYLAGGSIGSEDPGIPSMGWLMSDDDGDNIYTRTISLEAGTHQTFKYRTQPSYGWEGNWESVPPECGEGTYVDRFLDVDYENMTLDPVCWASCDACGPPPTYSDVTFQVDMAGTEVSSEGVFLHASFDGWGAIPMTDDDADCIYSVTVPDLIAGNVYDYLFQNGGTNELVPNSCESGINDWGGGVNRQFVVPDVDSVLDPVCFEQCEGDVCEGDCGVVVPSQVTFNVDMNCVEFDFATVYVTGPFIGWCGDCVALEDSDEDGVWTGVMSYDGGDLEYKYEVDNWADQEDLVDDMVAGGDCAPVTDYETFANRLISVAEDIEVFDTYGSCDECSTCGDGDLVQDGNVDILDVVAMVSVILGTSELEYDFAVCHGDLDNSGTVDILDVVQIIDWILNARAGEADASSAVLIQNNDDVSLVADGYIGAVKVVITHDDDFKLETPSDALLADYVTTGQTTTLIVVQPVKNLFTAQGEFEITQVQAASGSGYVDVNLLSDYHLLANHPNPFNPVTTVDYLVPQDGAVTLSVYNVLGKKIATLADGYSTVGHYSVQWNGLDAGGNPSPTGIYFISMTHASGVENQKIMLLK